MIEIREKEANESDRINRIENRNGGESYQPTFAEWKFHHGAN